MNKIVLLIVLVVTNLLNNAQGQGSFYRIKPTMGSTGSETIIMIGNIGISLSELRDSSASDCLRLWRKLDNRWNAETIDTVGYLYGSNLILYKSNKTSEHLIICESESEFYSDFRLYYLRDSIFAKIGNLPIQSNCNNCEDPTYPIHKLKIQNQNNEILIKPLVPFMYNIGHDNWKRFTPGESYLIIDKKSKEIIMHKR
jgi:hypothetical protein